MRTAVASIAVLLLLSVITVCPLLACPLKNDPGAAKKSCCHKAHSRPAPCPPPAARNCPYFTLERGKTTPVTTQALTLGVLPVSAELQLADRFQAVQVDGRVPDSERLFLRIRVLRV